MLFLDWIFGYSAGRIYDWSDRMTVGLANTFMDAGSAAIGEMRRLLPGTIKDDFCSNGCHVTALSVASRF